MHCRSLTAGVSAGGDSDFGGLAGEEGQEEKAEEERFQEQQQQQQQ